MWVELSEWARNMETFVSRECSLRVISTEDTFNNQVETMTHFVATSQPTS